MVSKEINPNNIDSKSMQLTLKYEFYNEQFVVDFICCMGVALKYLPE